MLGITSPTISSPPSSMAATPYRPGVQFVNASDVAVYPTATMWITDSATGRPVWSGQLSGPLTAAGATVTLTASTNFTPTAGHTYRATASIYIAVGRLSASSQAGPTTLTTTSTPMPGQRASIKVHTDIGRNIYVSFDEDEKPEVIQYPFYLL
jgi:hypothetical protein